MTLPASYRPTIHGNACPREPRQERPHDRLARPARLGGAAGGPRLQARRLRPAQADGRQPPRPSHCQPCAGRPAGRPARFRGTGRAEYAPSLGAAGTRSALGGGVQCRAARRWNPAPRRWSGVEDRRPGRRSHADLHPRSGTHRQDQGGGSLLFLPGLPRRSAQPWDAVLASEMASRGMAFKMRPCSGTASATNRSARERRMMRAENRWSAVRPRPGIPRCSGLRSFIGTALEPQLVVGVKWDRWGLRETEWEPGRGARGAQSRHNRSLLI